MNSTSTKKWWDDLNNIAKISTSRMIGWSNDTFRMWDQLETWEQNDLLNMSFETWIKIENLTIVWKKNPCK